jgi:hypothetical protein
MELQGLRPLTAAVATAMLVGACVSAGGAPRATASPAGSAAPGDTPAPSFVSNELVLRVVHEGGFVGPFTRLATPPIVTVYADGRIISPAPVTMEYPGRLVPPLQVRAVGADGARAILAAAAAAGLIGTDASYPAVGIADAPDTVFTVVEKGTRTTTRFGALAEAMGLPGGQGASEPARKAAAEFLSRLTDPMDTFGAPTKSTSLYAPTAFQVWVSPGPPEASDPTLTQEPVAWPLAVSLATFGTPAVPDAGVAGVRVGVVAGPDAATVGPLLAAANALTPFTSGGATFGLLVRPLLPDEAPAG